MAHGITDADTFAQTGTTKAWHGLGSFIPDGLSARDGFQKIGLGWDTELTPAYAEFNGVRLKLPVQAHVRCDTSEVLGVVSEGYRPVQNLELAEFADAIAGEDAAIRLETAGSLFRGRRVFALVRLPNTIKVAAGDDVVPYVLISNGHGGFATFSVYPTSVRVVCNNTLHMSEKHSRHGLKFVHTGKMDEKLKLAKAILGTSRKHVEVFEQKVKHLASTQLSAGQIRDFMELAYAETFKISEDDLDPSSVDRFRAKRAEVIEQWLENLENERNSIASIRGTSWAALNAVTEWHDWQRGRTREDADARVHSNVFGVSMEAKAKTMRLALAAGGAR